uniref:Uncharacterized protein n=1 Tax=viral metagenome TaxID=1070528 RepID=A0A6C0AE99_9ZZZZ
MIFLILNLLFSEKIISSFFREFILIYPFLVKIFVLQSKHGRDNDSEVKGNVC